MATYLSSNKPTATGQNMKPHELCKHHGIKGVTELARITGRSPRTLHAWANKSPEFFMMVVLGAAQFKQGK